MYNYLQNIFIAPVYDVAIQTPLQKMPRLSERLGHQIWAKREDLQPVFSFKCRGAYNRMFKLNDVERAKGVICSSAGNHAQGVALAAAKLNIQAVIVMPVTTPKIKIDAVQRLGGEWVDIVLHGDFYDEASNKAKELQAQHGYTYIHPFDDPDVIAGQGTVGLEILTQHPRPIDAVFMPIGGGGLAAGVALLIKNLRPDIKIIGVEPVDAASMTSAIHNNKRAELHSVGTFADGVAVKMPGEETFSLIRQYVDDFVNVTTDEICAAMKDLFEDTRAMAEPSGAVAVAGLKKWAAAQPEKNLTLMHIVSGANLNYDRLRYVTERTDIGEQREALFAVKIPEKAGSFLDIYKLFSDKSITEFNYRYQTEKFAQIFVGFQLTRGAAELVEIKEKLAAQSYDFEDLTQNEIAREHLRYMIGGARHVENERLFQIGFPERHGVIFHLLSGLSSDDNITLFHYRNHGADYGRVLVGLESSDESGLISRLEKIGFDFSEETHNEAYKRFLR